MSRRDRRAQERRWRKERGRTFASPSAVFRYLAAFHDPAQESKRAPLSAFIPVPNEHLRALGCVNCDFVAFVQSRSPQKRATGQQWAEVCFVPTWAGQSKNGPAYRFVATREALRQQLALPGHEEAEVDPDSVETPAGVRYKIRGIVTNRTLDGNELIAWYRERCGRSEEVHSVMKEDLAGGQLPSGDFGENAAWWAIMILALNLNAAMKRLVLPNCARKWPRSTFAQLVAVDYGPAQPVPFSSGLCYVDPHFNVQEKRMPEKVYDVLIIGGGPAGLTAGLYTSRAKLETLLVERMIMGGQVMTTTKVENYPGFPGGIDGPDLMVRFQEHCQEFGLQVEYGEVENLIDRGAEKIVVVDGREVRARCVIVTTGAEPRKLGIPGEQELTGRGVSYCATCDGAFFRGVPVAIVGGGDTAAEEALFLTRFASKVTLIHRRDQLRATKVLQDRLAANEKVEILWNTTVERAEGDASGLKAAEIKNLVSGERRPLPLEGLFVAVGVTPKAHFLADVLTLDADGYILTDAECRTSMPGVFAAGDVRKKILKQIATAVGDGAVAAIMAEKYLEDL